ncbi:hypothetical protein SAMN05444392_11551 [Seinonella peptonophila]|uniref:Uncharacterized protein n=1 Tax=Seinonella peptonophila TaxID=112248 RepID=A0A1M5AR53_9BACL|nr:hypothetical protein [Seinonella peptonophila]SHF32654.1 hypothetical protein SAMN05444392_11551 [Seinonella peptonophila]
MKSPDCELYFPVGLLRVIRYSVRTRDEQRDTQIYQMLFQMGGITLNQIRENLGEERMEHSLMDQTFIGGVPLEQLQSVSWSSVGIFLLRSREEDFLLMSLSKRLPMILHSR